MKIKFDKNGIFKLEINSLSSLIFTKKEDGCIAIKMPCFYNETTGELSKGVKNHILNITGTREMLAEKIKNTQELKPNKKPSN